MTTIKSTEYVTHRRGHRVMIELSAKVTSRSVARYNKRKNEKETKTVRQTTIKNREYVQSLREILRTQQMTVGCSLIII